MKNKFFDVEEFDFEVEKQRFIDNLSFNANIFKEVLSANKECESASLEISSEGLARITFNVDDYKSTYYMVSAQDAD
jgi:ribosome maturation factor RimP